MSVDEALGTLSVVGLGKLGAPMAALLASAGYGVIGVDVSDTTVEAINQGRAPVDEPGLDDLLSDAGDRLIATKDLALAALEAEAIFVIVPTPSLDDGRFDPGGVADAVGKIGAALRESDDPRLVVITSTLSPGDMERVIVPALEQSSGKSVGDTIGLCYSPEFVALGNVLEDMRTPDFLLIGESDPAAGDRLLEIYDRLCIGSPPPARMNFFEAELAKLAVNNFVTMRISFANQLAQICDMAGNADVDVVTGAIGLDSRIGTKYLRGALSYGGPCFPRDTLALERLAADFGLEAPLSAATQQINGLHSAHVARLVSEAAGPGGTVGVLGLAYKPNTPVLDESPSLALIDHLVARGHPVVAHDPEVQPGEAFPTNGLQCVQDLDEAVARAGTLVVATPWPEYAKISFGKRSVTVFDPWRIVDATKLGPGSVLRYIGKSDTIRSVSDRTLKTKGTIFA